MLEIIIVWQLCKKVGEIVRAKGRTAFGWQFLTVVFWFGGEVTGAIVGAILSDGEGVGLYLLALLGAGAGGASAYAIAHLLPDANRERDADGPSIACPNCGESIEDYVRACPMCGEPVT